MARTHPGVQFERYADDVVVHCAANQQAEGLLVAIENRLGEVGLQLNSAKTRIVYCKDGRRRGDHAHVAFTFLGFTFRARAARSRAGVTFTGFLPAVMLRRPVEGDGIKSGFGSSWGSPRQILGG